MSEEGLDTIRRSLWIDPEPLVLVHVQNQFVIGRRATVGVPVLEIVRHLFEIPRTFNEPSEILQKARLGIDRSDGAGRKIVRLEFVGQQGIGVP